MQGDQASSMANKPLEVIPMDGLVADGALSPAVVGEGQVVEDAGPAEHVAAAGNLGGRRWVQTATKKCSRVQGSILERIYNWVARSFFYRPKSHF
jgi:hypothetical protein